MRTIIAITLLMGLLAVAYANGPNMDDGTKKECDVVFKCFDKDCGDSDRDCFFDCLTKRDEERVGRDFRKDVKKVYQWCKSKKRGNDASEGKILKCTQKKVEKGRLPLVPPRHEGYPYPYPYPVSACEKKNEMKCIAARVLQRAVANCDRRAHSLIP